MRLHRTESSDWAHLASDQLNAWQRLAVGTQGIVTPGNFISVLGAVIVAYGLYELTGRHIGTGIVIVLVGRCADVLDGLAAEATRTKSSVGEALDATIDKVILALALVVLLGEQLLPYLVGIIMLLQAGYNSALSLIAKGRLKLHPSLSGKLSAAFEWLSVGLYVLAYQLRGHHSLARQASLVMAGLSFLVFAVLAGLSSYHYSEQLKRQGHSK